MSAMDKNRAAVGGKVILQASGYTEARNGPFHEVSATPRTVRYIRERIHMQCR